MKTLAAIVAAGFLFAPPGSALDIGPAKVRITQITNTRYTRTGFTYSSLLDRTGVSIGFSLLHCQVAIPPGTKICDGTYSLPHGRIDVHGLISSRTVFTLSVTGGTGTYQNAGGQLDAVTLTPGTLRLVFSLRGF